MDGGYKCSNQVEQGQKSNESVELPAVQERALQSVSGDESDESEIVEHDVSNCISIAFPVSKALIFHLL